MPELAKNGIRIQAVDQLNARAAWAKNSSRRRSFRLLTPLAVDASHPFPAVAEQRVQPSFARKPNAAGEPLHAIVQVPRVLAPDHPPPDRG
jgi:polyphosphate kinase